jgi:alpha-tubulin suppressor-like RCC1 family protein
VQTCGTDGGWQIQSCPTDVCSAGACVGAVQMATGGDHTCALLADATVRCWGSNGYGQLGDGTTTDRAQPAVVAGLSGVAGIAAGQYHTCAVLTDGTMRCWGFNGSGQLGDGTMTNRSSPVKVGIGNVLQVVAGENHTCARLSDASVDCWGNDYYGQLGNGSTTNVASPQSIPGLSGVAELAASQSNHTCARLTGGTVSCWGFNDYGQIGDGTLVNRTAPTAVMGLTGVLHVGVGGFHSCAVKTDTTVQCWGDVFNGGVGIPFTTSTSQTTPVAVSGNLSGVLQIEGGLYHTCALISDGTVQCWGANFNGDVGQPGPWGPIYAPAAVPGVTQAVEIRTGGSHTCARRSDGSITCWGYNFNGQLGDGTESAEVSPTKVAGVANVTQLAVGGNANNPGNDASVAFACGLLADTTVSCWGNNDYGQLGDGTTVSRGTPAPVKGLSGVTQIALGLRYSCALLGDGSVSCWGNGANPPSPSDWTPSPVAGLSGVTQLALGWLAFCALSNGTVSCWGNNEFGQLGDGTTTSRAAPAPVPGLTGVVSIAAGGGHACAITATATECWGHGTSGQLGNGAAVDDHTPSLVTGLTNALAIRAGYVHTCALLTGNTMSCWGANGSGQLGQGNQTSLLVPTAVPGLSGVEDIYAGFFHSCALLSPSGTVSCWGDDMVGEVGNGVGTTLVTSPTTIPAFSGVAHMGLAGSAPDQTCALMNDGTVDCWGYYQEIGRSTPMPVVWP